MFEITTCEVCGSNNLESVLNLGAHPLCDDLVEIGSDRVNREYPIEILFCKKCITAHQRFQVAKDELFPKTYHYRARMTKSVLDFMSGLVDVVEQKYGSLANKKVLDVGCNDGSLLNFFKLKGATTIGVDPTGAVDDAINNGHDATQGFFDIDIAKKIYEKYGPVDYITFTNVFAHIENLKGLIDALKVLISVNTKVIIENHYMGSVLESGQFDTFYHEHPRTYSMKSFEYIAESLGMKIVAVEFPKRYGGNIRVTMGQSNSENLPDVDETGFYKKLKGMQQDIETWKVEILSKIKELNSKYGPIPAKAFPGRAAILVKLLNLSDKEIEAVYEIKGSIKTGHYVPGTRIPILPEADLYKKDLSRPILNLAWHLPNEVRANLKNNGYVGQVLDIK
jgi:hypothetical protein